MSGDESQARHDTDEVIRLPYAPRPTESKTRRLIRLLSSCLELAPTPLIAVILVAPILLGLFLGWFADASWLATLLIYESLFLPGALKRRSALGACLTLIPAGLVTMWFETGWFAWMQEWDGYRPFAALSVTCVPLVALAILEAVLVSHPPRRRTVVLIWYIIAMFSVACVVEIGRIYIHFADFSVTRGNERYGVVMFSHPLLELSLSWALIASVNTAVAASKRNLRLLMIWCALAPTTFVFWAIGGVHRLAHRSLSEGSPFALRFSVLLLGNRGRAEDLRILRDVLATAHEEGQVDTYDSVFYWLRQYEPGRTANLVASLLSQRPSESTAARSADLLLEHHRYSAAPLLLRYALVGNSKCVKSLEDAGEPRAALGIVMLGGEIDVDVRRRLARLLGQDVGSAREAWGRLYDQVIGRLHSPLPPDIQIECDRVVRCFADFSLAVARKAEFVAGLGTAGASVGQRSSLASIRLPDWNAVSTDDLEREVRSYESRVDELIQSHLGRKGERP